MLHLREYYERALREFGSADSGKEIFFSPPQFIATSYFHSGRGKLLFVLLLRLLSCRVEPVSLVHDTAVTLLNLGPLFTVGWLQQNY